MRRALPLVLFVWHAAAVEAVPPLPAHARLVVDEDWSHGIASERWYAPRTKWGAGNNGVTRENVRVQPDRVRGREQNVLVCEAHGDRYAGPVVGLDGAKTRVGGVLISKDFFASGRFEITLKIGARTPVPGGPADPQRPKGAIPAVWTYAYRYVTVDNAHQDDFVPATPLYNPFMKAYGRGTNEFTSELDFPEFGKAGDFSKGLYNAYLPKRSDTGHRRRVPRLHHRMAHAARPSRRRDRRAGSRTRRLLVDRRQGRALRALSRQPAQARRRESLRGLFRRAR
jgi:hypothetical protein